MQEFLNKYTPKNLDEIIGNKKAITQMKYWIKDPKKPLFLYGESGIGKTLSAVLLSKENNYTLYYTDSSDVRDKNTLANLENILKTPKTLFGNKRLIVIDEIDGLTDKRGGGDYGGFSIINKAIKDTKQPIIFIANEPYKNQKLRPIFNSCEKIKFDLPNKLSILKFAKNICETENIEYDIYSLKQLVENSENDIRGVLLDLFTLTKSKKITLEDIESIGNRRKEKDIFKVLQKIFYAKDFYETKNLIDKVNIDWDLLKEWVVENVPRQYKDPNNLTKAYYNLSKADINIARIRNQKWILLKYVFDYITLGVAYSKENPEKRGFSPFVFPTSITKRNTKETNLLKSIVEKIKQKNHCSKRIILRDHIPYLKIIIPNTKNLKNLIKYYEFDIDELKYLGCKITKKEYTKMINYD